MDVHPKRDVNSRGENCESYAGQTINIIDPLLGYRKKKGALHHFGRINIIMTLKSHASFPSPLPFSACSLVKPAGSLLLPAHLRLVPLKVHHLPLSHNFHIIVLVIRNATSKLRNKLVPAAQVADDFGALDQQFHHDARWIILSHKSSKPSAEEWEPASRPASVELPCQA